ncbi:MAG: hypothetical protein AB9897_05315 [Anaerolineaceae bacterium]
MRKIAIITFVLLICLTIIAGCASTQSTTTPAASSGSSSTVSDGKTLMNDRCTACHTLAQVVNSSGTTDQWQRVVDQMIQRGAILSPEEETVLVKYLADNFN